MRTFVIVGGGLAGGKAVETLRAEGYDGRLVLVTNEPERPYERPPLSKDYLRGEADRDAAYVHPAEYYKDNDIELRTETTATALHPAEREVELDTGERLAYDALLLAPGAEPRRLDVPGANLPGVHVLRTLADSDALRDGIRAGARIVIAGAGWIGAEVAASARMLGAEVTLVEPQSVPLERVLGPEAGAMYRDVHAEHGVTFLSGEGIAAFEGAHAVERVTTTGGRTLDCDLALVGIGVRPRTELAAAAGLEVGDGVLADPRLETSAPGVFVAGDVASHQHPFYGERIRVEHWFTALEHGPAAARAMLGAQAPFDKLPYFFSDQYDVGMEYAGLARDWDRVAVRGDLAGRECIFFWLREGRVLAGMNVNVWDVTDTIQRIIRSRTAVDERRLTDPDVPLEQLAPAEETAAQ